MIICIQTDKDNFNYHYQLSFTQFYYHPFNLSQSIQPSSSAKRMLEVNFYLRRGINTPCLGEKMEINIKITRYVFFLFQNFPKSLI